MKNLRFLAGLAVPTVLAATAACGDPDCSVTKTCNVGNTTASSGGASTSTTSSAQGGAGTTGTGGMSTGSGGTGGQAAAPGDVIWERSFGDVSSDDPKRLVLQSDESVVIGGDFEGSIDFGGATSSRRATREMSSWLDSAVTELRFGPRSMGAAARS